MGLIAKVSEFTRKTIDGFKISEVKGIIEGGDISTLQHASPSGDDSHPITKDSLIIVRTQQTGSGVSVGYFDTINTPKAQPGDKRIYSRNPGDGLQVAEVWIKSDGTVVVSNQSNGAFELKPDGSIKGSNGAGTFELQPSGNFVVNGAIISSAGVITDIAGKVLGTHTHPIPGGTTGPPS